MSHKFLNKKHGYKVPKNYFEDFTMNQLANQIHTADNGTKKSGFKVPESYFESFEFQPKAINNNAAAIKKRNNSWIFALSGLAATVSILVMLNLSKSKSIQEIDELAYTEIEDYLLFEDVDINTLNITTDALEDLSLYDTALKDEDVVEYLINISENEFYDYE